MRIVVLGGAGAMGQVTVRDLSESQAVSEVVIADFSPERAEQVKKQLASDKVSAVRADITDPASLAQAFKGAVVVVNAAPYQFNVPVMEACLAAGCHYLDLGGLFHVTQKQLELDKRFKEKNLLAVLGMGAAPGMTNIMAADAAADLDEVEAVDMVVAGVDFAESEHPFLPPYALETILDEYAMEPMVCENGRIQAMPPMSGEAFVDMPEPVGRVKAFLTLHSEIATIPYSFQNKGIKRATYSLGLPEQFHERAKFLVELGFGVTGTVNVDGVAVKPRRMLQAMINTHPLPQAEPNDCEVVRVDVKGKNKGREVLIRMESIIHSHPTWKVSCGALDTGAPPSIVAQMIAQGTIKATGALAPELCVPAEPFFRELSKRGIPMSKTLVQEKQPAQFHS